MTDNPTDSVVTEAMTLTRRLQLVYDWLEERGQRYHCQTLDIVMSQASPPPLSDEVERRGANEIERLREALTEARSVLTSTYETHKRARNMVPDEEEGLAAQVFARAINHADTPIIRTITKIDEALSIHEGKPDA